MIAGEMVACHLTSPVAAAELMADALQTEDASYIARAMGVVARAKGMTELALRTALTRRQAPCSRVERFKARQQAVGMGVFAGGHG